LPVSAQQERYIFYHTLDSVTLVLHIIFISRNAPTRPENRAAFLFARGTGDFHETDAIPLAGEGWRSGSQFRDHTDLNEKVRHDARTTCVLFAVFRRAELLTARSVRESTPKSRFSRSIFDRTDPALGTARRLSA